MVRVEAVFSLRDDISSKLDKISVSSDKTERAVGALDRQIDELGRNDATAKLAGKMKTELGVVQREMKKTRDDAFETKLALDAMGSGGGMSGAVRGQSSGHGAGGRIGTGLFGIGGLFAPPLVQGAAALLGSVGGAAGQALPLAGAGLSAYGSLFGLYGATAFGAYPLGKSLGKANELAEYEKRYGGHMTAAQRQELARLGKGVSPQAVETVKNFKGVQNQYESTFTKGPRGTEEFALINTSLKWMESTGLPAATRAWDAFFPVVDRSVKGLEGFFGSKQGKNDFERWITQLAPTSEVLVKVIGEAAHLGASLAADFSPLARTLGGSLAGWLGSKAEWADSAKGISQIETFSQNAQPLVHGLVMDFDALGEGILKLGQGRSGTSATYILDHLAESTIPKFTHFIGEATEYTPRFVNILGDLAHSAGLFFGASSGLKLALNLMENIAKVLQSLAGVSPEALSVLTTVGGSLLLGHAAGGGGLGGGIAGASIGGMFGGVPGTIVGGLLGAPLLGLEKHEVSEKRLMAADIAAGGMLSSARGISKLRGGSLVPSLGRTAVEGAAFNAAPAAGGGVLSRIRAAFRPVPTIPQSVTAYSSEDLLRAAASRQAASGEFGEGAALATSGLFGAGTGAATTSAGRGLLGRLLSPFWGAGEEGGAAALTGLGGAAAGLAPLALGLIDPSIYNGVLGERGLGGSAHPGPAGMFGNNGYGMLGNRTKAFQDVLSGFSLFPSGEEGKRELLPQRSGAAERQITTQWKQRREELAPMVKEYDHLTKAIEKQAGHEKRQNELVEKRKSLIQSIAAIEPTLVHYNPITGVAENFNKKQGERQAFGVEAGVPGAKLLGGIRASEGLVKAERAERTLRARLQKEGITGKPLQEAMYAARTGNVGEVSVLGRQFENVFGRGAGNPLKQFGSTWRNIGGTASQFSHELGQISGPLEHFEKELEGVTVGDIHGGKLPGTGTIKKLLHSSNRKEQRDGEEAAQFYMKGVVNHLGLKGGEATKVRHEMASLLGFHPAAAAGKNAPVGAGVHAGGFGLSFGGGLVKSSAEQIESKAGELKKAGQKASESFAEGLGSNQSSHEAARATEPVIKGMLYGASPGGLVSHETQEAAQKGGATISSQYALGIQSKEGAVRNAAQRLVKAAFGALNTVPGGSKGGGTMPQPEVGAGGGGGKGKRRGGRAGFASGGRVGGAAFAAGQTEGGSLDTAILRSLRSRIDEEAQAGGGPKMAALIANGNRMTSLRKPYLWGGGHGATASRDGAWDCSGGTTELFDGAGWNFPPMVSGGFMNWERPGKGAATVLASPDHVYSVLKTRGGPKAIGTSASNPGEGYGWISDYTYRPGFSERHANLGLTGGVSSTRMAGKGQKQKKGFAAGGRVPGMRTPEDSVDISVSPKEFVVTDDGERQLERMTFPGVLNWLEGEQRPHFRAGGRPSPEVLRHGTATPGTGSGGVKIEINGPVSIGSHEDLDEFAKELVAAVRREMQNHPEGGGEFTHLTGPTV